MSPLVFPHHCECCQVFHGRGNAGGVDGIDAHVNIFRTAQVIFGPHGAGLSNMIFAPQNASVLEFSMKPHCNRCFGFMAMALGMDYWLVPQVSCFYHLRYEMDSGKAAAVMRLLRHVLEAKGLGHLIRQRDEL